METVYRYYNHTRMDAWAQSCLTEQELEQYKNANLANSLLWKSYSEQGLYTVEYIFETCYSTLLESNIQVKIGEKLYFAPNVTINSLELHAEYRYWLDRYNAETGGDRIEKTD